MENKQIYLVFAVNADEESVDCVVSKEVLVKYFSANKKAGKTLYRIFRFPELKEVTSVEVILSTE